MTGTVLRLVAATYALAMMFAPATLTFAFEPLVRNGAPAIYRQTSLLHLTLSHLGIVLAAMLVATAVGMGLAILVTREGGREFRPVARLVTQIGQTFPPVAVLALAVPALGFGTWPTLMALILYGLLPIFENTFSALTGLPGPVREAADGMGMTGAQRLWQVELPLALPVILTGIRISLVIAFSTATIGSAVAARTLGEVIIAGLLSGNSAFVVQGGLMVGALAILMHDALVWVEGRVAHRPDGPHAVDGPDAKARRPR